MDLQTALDAVMAALRDRGDAADILAITFANVAVDAGLSDDEARNLLDRWLEAAREEEPEEQET